MKIESIATSFPEFLANVEEDHLPPNADTATRDAFRVAFGIDFLSENPHMPCPEEAPKAFRAGWYTAAGSLSRGYSNESLRAFRKRLKDGGVGKSDRKIAIEGWHFADGIEACKSGEPFDNKKPDAWKRGYDSQLDKMATGTAH